MHVIDLRNANARQERAEKNYWKRFYKHYTKHLFRGGSYDNYVGLHFKVLRTFFSYLEKELDIKPCNVFNIFYVRNENIPVVALTMEQLQFLIYDTQFEDGLPQYLKRTKDIFIFGCTVGLRFSDLMNLSKLNVQHTASGKYLCVRSIKTKTDTRIKLPDYLIPIIEKYKYNKKLLPQLSNNRLNLNVKELCKAAGWKDPVGKQRERLGVANQITKNGKPYRFCDLVTTHTMRRTSITVLLTLGMPEMLVRKISGHSPNSKEFYKYVNYSQLYIDNGIERIYDQIKQNRPQH